jgi:hypothetical protein
MLLSGQTVISVKIRLLKPIRVAGCGRTLDYLSAYAFRHHLSLKMVRSARCAEELAICNQGITSQVSSFSNKRKSLASYQGMPSGIPQAENGFGFSRRV